ncbi:protein of unknown function [Micropruina glycogenica]|uniref:Uncharacterized protein n=1 Tax=Micropruina glycogenica TaxID=75385 RepID=A0A2N9JBD2_9ACTN|nr:protein of unknown function [Micropruina glycogenica]
MLTRPENPNAHYGGRHGKRRIRRLVVTAYGPVAGGSGRALGRTTVRRRRPVLDGGPTR